LGVVVDDGERLRGREAREPDRSLEPTMLGRLDLPGEQSLEEAGVGRLVPLFYVDHTPAPESQTGGVAPPAGRWNRLLEGKPLPIDRSGG
jgi:hypothetical protein